MAGIPEQPE